MNTAISADIKRRDINMLNVVLPYALFLLAA